MTLSPMAKTDAVFFVWRASSSSITLPRLTPSRSFPFTCVLPLSSDNHSLRTVQGTKVKLMDPSGSRYSNVDMVRQPIRPMNVVFARMLECKDLSVPENLNLAVLLLQAQEAGIF